MTAKRHVKSEAKLLDHATNNLLRALKCHIQKKDGGVNYDKLRKDGDGHRLLSRLEQV